MAYLKVNNLEKKFNNISVLKNISFEVNKNEVLCIIGKSGSGKTTLLRCLNYLETADNGEVILNDDIIFESKKFKKIKENEKRKYSLNFGLVFQSYNLFPQYTAFENIKLPLELLEKRRKKDGLPPLLNRPIDDEVFDLLEKVGLSEKVNSYPFQLSGGESQRVAIARAMILKPKVLCFDEPTSALDPSLKHEVIKVIKELKSNNDITMIIVTHDMDLASSIADNVIFMSKGEIIESGKPGEIFSNPKSTELMAFLDNPVD